MSDLESPSVDGPAPDTPSEHELDEDLSPSVRRLVRHYDLDITGIHGSGPAGRIRVGDVMPLLGGRESVAAHDDREAPNDDRGTLGAAAAEEVAEAGESAVAPATTARIATVVFECDLSRVLVAQRRAREQGKSIAVESYVVQACARALAAVPAVNAGAGRTDLAITIDGEPAARRVLLRDPETLELDGIEYALDAAAESTGTAATFAMRYHGPSGSVLALGLEPEPGTHAMLGVGKLRKVVTVKTVEGEDTPRISAMCHLSLSFDPHVLDEHTAHAFLRTLVATLES